MTDAPRFTQVRAETAPVYAAPVRSALPDRAVPPAKPYEIIPKTIPTLPPDLETYRAARSGAFVLALVAFAIALTAIGTAVWLGIGLYRMETRPYADCIVTPENSCLVVTDRDGLVVGAATTMSGYQVYTLATMTPVPSATPKARKP